MIPLSVVHQAPLSMKFSRQEYRNGLSFPSSGDLPDPGIEPGSTALLADTLPTEPAGKPLKDMLITQKLKENTSFGSQGGMGEGLWCNLKQFPFL